MKKWIIRDRINRDTIIHSNKLINNLLLSRGIDKRESVNEFLNPDLSRLHNPYLMKDMDRAVERIDDAIRKREKVVIYGDYDVDGITSTSILYRAFKKLGVDVSYYIPDRMNEGYGINKNALDYLKSIAANLIITVDTGISAIEEVEYVKSLGMDIIVTDHHECKDIIPDTIVINPKRSDCGYPCKTLAGCGIAFKLIQALWIHYGLSGFEDALDIAAIGTIADVVELKGENRVIVKHGLERVAISEKCGIKALKAVAGMGDSISSYGIAFQIAPRINAVGRLSDAKIAVELFTTNDYDKALQIAKYLDQENRNRQRIEEEILKEAFEKIDKEVDLKRDRVIVLSSPNWHVGVIGIVASRIVEKFNRPVILIGEEGNLGRGSGRSIGGFNLFENLLKLSDYMVKFGGHELAAGLTIEIDYIDEFRKELNLLAEKVSAEVFAEKLYIDMKVDNDEATLETAEILKLFEPYGSGNPSPVFSMEELSVVYKKGVGNNEQHLKMSLEKDELRYDAIMFNGSREFLDKDWNFIDIVFNMDINEWNNNRNLQFLIRDMKPHVDWVRETIFDNYYRYIRPVINQKLEKFDFTRIKLLGRDIEFLKAFAYFKRGYILVSSIESLKEIEFLFDYLNVSVNLNSGLEAQIIVCPRVEDIDFGNNEVLIYDFLPGEYEYKIVSDKVKGPIYNYNGNSVQRLQSFKKDITVDRELVNRIYSSVKNGEFIGRVRDMAEACDVNIYKAYRAITLLKENKLAEVLVKGELLKITYLDNLKTIETDFTEHDRIVEKIDNLNIKFKELFREE